MDSDITLPQHENTNELQKLELQRLLNSGSANLKQERYTEALKDFYAAHAIDAHDTQILLNILECYTDQDRLIEAKEVADKILALDPTSFHARFAHASILRYSEKVDPAIEILKELIQEQPNNHRALGLLCDCYIHGNYYHEALKLGKKLPKTSLTPSYYNGMGLALLELGSFKKSISFFREGFKLCLKDIPEVLGKQPIFVKPDDLKYTLFKIKAALDDLKIPFMLVFGTLLGIYRDGHLLLHDKDLDLALPWKTPRLELIHALKSYGFHTNYTEEQITGSKGQWNISVTHEENGMVVDFFFAKPDTQGNWLTGLMKGDHLICFSNKATGTQTLQYENYDFTVMGDIERYLSESYGADWRTPKPNYNTLILGDNIIDKDGVGILLGYNHCLVAICKGSYKKAHGLCMQLLSVHDDPLLEQVKQHLEKHIQNQEWYPPIPYRKHRTNNKQLFGYR